MDDAASFRDETRDGSNAPGRGAARPLRELAVAVALRRSDEEGSSSFERFLAAARPLDALGEWFGRAPGEVLDWGADTIRARLDRDIAALDALLGEQLDLVLHHPDLQALESAWRGLDLLLDAADDDDRVRVRLLSVSWDELCRDFDKASEFDQSRLFEKVYSEEFGMPGGLPYGLIVCDYAVQHRRASGRAGSRADDISGLTALSSVGAAAFAPCIVAADPRLFGVGSFAELSHVQDLGSFLKGEDYARWRRFQERPESRFLGIVMPRMLLRRPWPDDGRRGEAFRFGEGHAGLRSGDWLWGSAVYAFGAVVVRAFRENGWFADIRGTRTDSEEAGLVNRLPRASFSTNEAAAYRPPVEVALTDRKQRAFEELGFITLSPCPMTPDLAFLGTQSAYSEAHLGSRGYQENSRISAMLHYVLCVSRFAHYVKVIARDRVGSHSTAEDLEGMLNGWLRDYAVGEVSSEASKRRHPLREGWVRVSDVVGKPGTFNCIMHLQPHFQIDQVVAGFNMYTEIQGLRI